MAAPVRVLCVSGSASDLAPIRKALERASFPVEILPALAPEELTQRLSGTTHDAVIADADAPWVKVEEILDLITDAPVILVAANGAEGLLIEALERGASDYIPKHPPHIHRLPKSLENLLETRRLRQEKTQAEASLAHLLEYIPGAVISTDGELRITGWNPGAATLYGWEESEVLGKPLPPLLGQSGAESWDAPFWREVLAGSGWEGRAEHRRKNGALLRVHSSITVTRGPVGQVKGVTLVQRDETEAWRQEQYRAAELLINRAMVETASLDHLVSRFLGQIGRGFGWDNAELWMVERNAGVLRLSHTWAGETLQADSVAIDAASSSVIQPGEGIAGTVWATGEPVAVEDVTKDPRYRPWPAAQEADLRGATFLPVTTGREFVGVLAFYCRARAVPGGAGLRTLRRLARQLGCFIERRRMEEALAESKERLDLALSASGMVSWVWEGATTRAMPQERYEALTGLSADCGFEAFMQAVHPEDQEKVREALNDAMKTGSCSVEFRLLHPDGTTRWIRDYGTVTYSDEGVPVRVGGVFMDITEQRAVQDALEEERNSLRALVDTIPGFVYFKDRQHRFGTVNWEAVRFTGAASKTSIEGKTDYDFFPEHIAAEYIAEERDLMATGKALLERIDPLAGPHGETRWVLTRKTPLKDSAGRVRGLVGIGTDITEQVAASQEQERLIGCLNERIKELSTIRTVRDLIEEYAESSLDELMPRIAEALPLGLRYPEKMAVQIRVGDRTAESAGFLDTEPARYMEFVTADGEEQGHVKVVWREPPPEGCPAFLSEEEQLVDHVTRTLAGHVSRRLAEARYAAERQLTEHMMNNLPGWVFLVSRDGHYVRLNRRFAEATGYTNGELWGMDYTEVVAPPDKEAVVRAFHKVFDEGYAEVEARITRKNGETVPYLFVVSRVTLEDEPYLLGFGLDISQRRKVEEDNRLLRSAVENATEAIILTEGRTEAPGPRIVYANNAFLRMTGYPREEVVGRRPRFVIGPKTDMRVIRELRDHLLEGREFSGETTNYRKDRTEFLSEWSVAPVCDPSGEKTHFVAILRDVTERRRLESQLWSSMRLDSIGRLAGGVAHDFNNLLAVIMGYSELVACSLAEDSPIASDIEDIRQAAKRGGNLTRQLLAFSRRQVLTRRVIQLNEVVIHMERMLTRIIGADIELQLALAEGLWPAKLDIAQMEQVILNLVVNAREAMPRGGRLVIETANAEVDDTYARRRPSIMPGRHIMLTVSDTGTGMDKATADNIFEPFFTTKEQNQGAGLGLATVYGIVKQSGGDIWVYSEPGKGSSFKMLFPAASLEEHLPDAESETSTQLAGGSETVLVVEDEEAVRYIMERTLKRQGYTVLAASSGPQALDMVSHHEGPIDLLVTDVVMPGMSGHELAQRLRERQPGVNVLYVSGYPQNIISQHGVLIPGSEFLQKPFTPAALAEKVRQTLDKGA